MRKIKVAYDITTPESAEAGDVAESGWVDEEGREIVPDEFDIDQYGSESAAAVALAVKEIDSCVEASQYPNWAPGTWYIDVDPVRDYRTGDETRRSYHLEGFSQEEERLIYAALCKSQI